VKIHKTVSGLLLGAFALVMGACGGGGTTLDKEEATGVMQAALTASQSASTKLESGLSGSGAAEVSVELTADHFKVDGKVISPDGGTAAVSGEGNKTSDGYEAELSIFFDNWKVQEKGLVLSGELEMSASTVTDGATTTVEARYSGELEVSGSTEGTVVFDFSVKSKVSPTGICVSAVGEVGGASIDSAEGC
jgi:hypothetical protein